MTMKRRKSSSTCGENNSVDLVDRISFLPDSILGLILSNLPTKNAVATTILSKRWKLVWMNVHTLDFSHNDDCDNRLPEEEDIKFVQFVNRVLLLLDGGGGLLNKFSLVWGPRFVPSEVKKWINNAITKKVHHLSVSVYSAFYVGWNDGFYSDFEAMEMPVSLFSFVSLQSLELNGCISISTAIAICLPRLESLKLVSVHFQSEEAFENLIFGCPMLNYLNLDMHLDEIQSYSGICLETS